MYKFAEINSQIKKYIQKATCLNIFNFIFLCNKSNQTVNVISFIKKKKSSRKLGAND